jgi:hypothetical protein
MVHSFHAKQQHQNMSDSERNFISKKNILFYLLVVIEINFLDISEQ